MSNGAVASSDQQAWVLPALWGAILLGSTAAAFWAMKAPPPVFTLPPPPPPPPSEYEAAVYAVQAHPEQDATLLATQAFHASHPECPTTPDAGGVDCVAAYIRVKGYVDSLLVPPEPVVKELLPNQCDPLTVPPAGMVCVPAGDVWVLRLEQPIIQADFLDQTQANEIRFAADYEEAEVGAAWPIQVLDAWLEQQRQADNLLTFGVDAGPTSLIALGWPKWHWDALAWPGARETYQALSGKQNDFGAWPYESSAAAAIRLFAETHFVLTPYGSVRIIDLPHTQATQQLRTAIISYVVGFQNRTFGD